MWRIRPSGLERLMRWCGQRGNHEDGGGKGGSDSHWVLLFLVLRGGGGLRELSAGSPSLRLGCAAGWLVRELRCA